jgi:hypothetical protein
MNTNSGANNGSNGSNGSNGNNGSNNGSNGTGNGVTRRNRRQSGGAGVKLSGSASGKISGGLKLGLGKKKQHGGAKTVGTKAQVWHGTAKKTSGGLTKKDLMKTKKGRIVSKKKHAAGKKALKRLAKAGYKAKKGTFKLFKRG